MREDGLRSEGASLCDLPQVLVNKIADTALETMKPKEAARLATTSVSLRAAVASDRIYWRLCCARHTFMTTTMTQAEDLLQVTDDKWWFNWYMQRMHTRWLVRRTVQRFMKFLDPQSAAAFNSGAPMTNIDAFQCKTCFRFPWQVWELYKYRNGQVDGHDRAVFVSSSRLLQLHEIQDAVGLQHQGSRLRNSKGNDAMVPITSEFEGRKRFYAGESGSIYLGTDFQNVRVADSLVAWLQKWLT